MSASLRPCNVKDGIQLHVIISRESFRREGEIFVRGFTGDQLGLTSTTFKRLVVTSDFESRALIMSGDIETSEHDSNPAARLDRASLQGYATAASSRQRVDADLALQHRALNPMYSTAE